MEYSYNSCFEKVANLLSKNNISEAIALLEKHIFRYPELRDLWKALISNSAFYERIENHFRLGSIEWETYNTSHSKIIIVITEVAEEVCRYTVDYERERNLGRVSNQKPGVSPQRIEPKLLWDDDWDDINRRGKKIKANMNALIKELEQIH